MAADGWWSGDLDVRRPVRDIELLMEADDLHVAEVITWRNDKEPLGRPTAETAAGAFRRQSLLPPDGRRVARAGHGTVAAESARAADSCRPPTPSIRR